MPVIFDWFLKLSKIYHCDYYQVLYFVDIFKLHRAGWGTVSRLLCKHCSQMIKRGGEGRLAVWHRLTLPSAPSQRWVAHLTRPPLRASGVCWSALEQSGALSPQFCGLFGCAEGKERQTPAAHPLPSWGDATESRQGLKQRCCCPRAPCPAHGTERGSEARAGLQPSLLPIGRGHGRVGAWLWDSKGNNKRNFLEITTKS